MITKTMKIYKLFILLVISLLLSCSNCLFAQTILDGFQDVRVELDRVFSGINKNRIPTKILLDRAINYANVKRYDGTCLADSTIVNRHIFEDVLRTLNEASVSNAPLMTDIPNMINMITEPVSSDGEVTLVHAFFKYNSVKENAIEDGLLRVNNGILFDVYENNVWVNPYNDKYVFALTSGTDICTKTSVLNGKSLIAMAS